MGGGGFTVGNDSVVVQTVPFEEMGPVDVGRSGDVDVSFN